MKLLTLSFFLIFSINVSAMCQSTQVDGSSPNATVQGEAGLIKVSIMYPFSEGKSFNMEYYKAKHMPMVAALLNSNLVKYTIEKGLASGIPSMPLPYFAIGTFYVRSLDDYLAAVGPKRNEIRADFANYTDVSPVILISEVVK